MAACVDLTDNLSDDESMQAPKNVFGDDNLVSSDEEEFDLENICLVKRLQNKKKSKISERSSLLEDNEDSSSPPPDKKGKTRNSVIPEDSEESKSSDPRLLSAYLRERVKGVRDRTFDLSGMPSRETVTTGRTIKKMGGWSSSLWPALREFLQNTIDHLGLLDHSTGRRHAALTLRVSSSNMAKSGNHTPGAPRMTVYSFLCGEEVVCSITVVGADELVIEQAYTFPLPARALDTGVPDTSKQNGTTAGGFGDGFKTAAVALLSLGPKDFTALSWRFDAASTAVTWDFLGRRRERVGTFAPCQVLEVDISKVDSGAGGRSSAATSTAPGQRENWMTQRICVKGIGAAFQKDAVPKLSVFWDLPPLSSPPIPSMVRMSASGRQRGGGGDFLAEAASLPLIPNASSSSSSLGGARARPTPGVYVRGIWVKPPKIEGCVMAYFGDRLDVSGRDRNDVDEEELVNATARVLRSASSSSDASRASLAALLQPLCGKPQSSSSSSSSSSTPWLLRSPRFFNRVLEAHKDFFVHDLFGFPRGAVFVSSRTTNSKDPFVAWAAKFLAAHNNAAASADSAASGGGGGSGRSRGGGRAPAAALVPLNPGAHKALFEEVSAHELTERCVKILLAEDRSSSASTDGVDKELKLAVKKSLAFLGLAGGGGGGGGRSQRRGAASSVKVVFSTSVTMAFVHNGTMLFCPSAPLTRALLVKTLNVVHSQVMMLLAESSGGGGGEAGDGFTSLIQAIFETLPSSGAINGGASLTSADVEKAIARAGAVRKENEAFLRHQATAAAAAAAPLPTSSSLSNTTAASAPHHSTSSSACAVSGEEIVIDDSDDDDPPTGSSSSGSRAESAGSAGTQSRGMTSGGGGQPRGTNDLLRQIADTTRRGGGSGRGGGATSGAVGELIPSGAFAADAAGAEECLRPSSALVKVAASASVGGGDLFCDGGTAAALHSAGHVAAASGGGGGGEEEGGGSSSRKKKKGMTSEAWTSSACRRLAALRSLLEDAVALVARCLPSTKALLTRVRHGFDAANTSYEAFCDGTWIVVNFATYMPKLPTAPPVPESASSSTQRGSFTYPRTLLHDLVVTLTHELAHMLEASGGHGPAWRDTHMALLMEVYADLFPGGGGGLLAPGGTWVQHRAPTACFSCASCAASE